MPEYKSLNTHNDRPQSYEDRLQNNDDKMQVEPDRNFDSVADHFANKIYGGLKGQIRLAVLERDLNNVVSKLTNKLNRPLRILDIGAGLAQLSIQFASNGHEVTVNDISENMLQHAKKHAETKQIVNNIKWLVGPYQALENELTDQYDLILCHALLEWLEQPQQVIPFFKQWLAAEGILSLCFYNPVSFVYRNLIMGNFNLLNNSDYKSDNKRSLTPNNPVKYEQVSTWLEQNAFEINDVSGLRVFHDYVSTKRGGNTIPEAVIDMELRYSTQPPYKWMGRYLHVLASLKAV